MKWGLFPPGGRFGGFLDGDAPSGSARIMEDRKDEKQRRIWGVVVEGQIDP